VIAVANSKRQGYLAGTELAWNFDNATATAPGAAAGRAI
jgi:hypothetical protein